MITAMNWLKSYRAAVLETDWMRILQRIKQAESIIAERRYTLFLDPGGSPEERDAVAAAINGLKILREEVSEWQNRTAVRIKTPYWIYPHGEA